MCKITSSSQCEPWTIISLHTQIFLKTMSNKYQNLLKRTKFVVSWRYWKIIWYWCIIRLKKILVEPLLKGCKGLGRRWTRGLPTVGKVSLSWNCKNWFIGFQCVRIRMLRYQIRFIIVYLIGLIISATFKLINKRRLAKLISKSKILILKLIKSLNLTKIIYRQALKKIINRQAPPKIINCQTLLSL